MQQFKAFVQGLVPITDSQFDLAMPFFEVRHLQKGEHFAKQGAVCRHIAFVCSGTVKVYYTTEKAVEVTSCFCTEGHFTTAYKSFVLGQYSDRSLVALEDCQLLTIEQGRLEELYAIDSIWQTVSRIVIEHEYLTMEQYASTLNTQTAKEKYIQLLREQPHVLLVAKVEEVASYLGVTRRTLSRIRRAVSGSGS